MTLKLYSKPQCVQCVATQKELDRKGIPYEYIDIIENDEARVEIMDLGYMQAPVCIVGDKHWSGFRPDMIGALTNPEVTN